MLRVMKRLWSSDEYHYLGSFGFIPKIDGYLHEDEVIRPCLIVVPGGGYQNVTPIEGEPVAMKFFEQGYQVFVCCYSTNPLRDYPLHDQPMKDMARAIRLIRKNAAEYRIDINRIYACGFSAGAHLVGLVAVHADKLKDENQQYDGLSCSLKGIVLGYPVTTCMGGDNGGSFDALLGVAGDEREKQFYDLISQVHENVPPIFLWHTATDELVPVSNSMRFIQACRTKQIPFAMHIFSDGIHGLSVADHTVNPNEQNEYTLEQLQCIQKAVKAGKLQIHEEQKEYLDIVLNHRHISKDVAKPEVSDWVKLAIRWLHQCG